MYPTESQCSAILEELCSDSLKNETCDKNCSKCPLNFNSDTKIEELRKSIERIIIATSDKNTPSCLFCKTQNKCKKKQDALKLMRHHRLGSDVLTFLAEDCQNYKRIEDEIFEIGNGGPECKK
jgi:hypothetical protein